MRAQSDHRILERMYGLRDEIARSADLLEQAMAIAAGDTPQPSTPAPQRVFGEFTGSAHSVITDTVSHAARIRAIAERLGKSTADAPVLPPNAL